jgi:hypothetical protein
VTRLPIANRGKPASRSLRDEALKKVYTCDEGDTTKTPFDHCGFRRTLLADTDRTFGGIATDFEQFMPRGWAFAARGIVGEVRCR